MILKNISHIILYTYLKYKWNKMVKRIEKTFTYLTSLLYLVLDVYPVVFLSILLVYCVFGISSS